MTTLNNLPTDLLKIIQNYKDQIDHSKKMVAALKDIKEMSYEIKGGGEHEIFSLREIDVNDYSICSPNIFGGLRISNDEGSTTIKETLKGVEIIVSYY